MAAFIGMGLITVLAVGFWIYTETPAGKRWIKSL